MLKSLFNNLKAMFSNSEGQGMVEYGLIIALIAVVVLVALGLIGGQIKTMFNAIVTALGGTPAP